MNFRYVFNQMFALLLVLSAVMLGVELVFFAVRYFQRAEVDSEARLAFLIVGGVGLLVGAVLWITTRATAEEQRQLGRREALLLVALSWIVGAGFSALPYFLWAHAEDFPPGGHPFLNFVDCYFEAMSGLTTTGASVLSDIEAVPRSILLWRAFTHWLGGLGIVVLFVAVLPTLGVGGRKLFRVEAPGPSPEGVTPHIRETARLLWYVYLGLTIAQIVALMIAGMDLFDASCHTFATLATGGFSTRNASIASFDSIAIETIIIVFMVLAGINFGLYFRALRGRVGAIWRDTEFRCYVLIILGASALVVLGLAGERIVSSAGVDNEPSIGSAIRHGVFQVVALQTTTGFVTADFNQWGILPKAVLLVLMFIGASAGSTGGGIKVIRIWITFKVMLAEIERVFRPNVIRPVKVGDTVITDTLRLGTVAYVLGILLLFLLGTFVIMMIEQRSGVDFTTAATASAATLNNIGPGLARVGAIENFGWFTSASKLVMCLLMALGRLEVFAIVVLFSPRFWKTD